MRSTIPLALVIAHQGNRYLQGRYASGAPIGPDQVIRHWCRYRYELGPRKGHASTTKHHDRTCRGRVYGLAHLRCLAAWLVICPQRLRPCRLTGMGETRRAADDLGRRLAADFSAWVSSNNSSSELFFATASLCWMQTSFLTCIELRQRPAGKC